MEGGYAMQYLRIVAEWYQSKNAWCITNGLSVSWCEADEYNETIQQLEEELDRYLAQL